MSRQGSLACQSGDVDVDGQIVDRAAVPTLLERLGAAVGPYRAPSISVESQLDLVLDLLARAKRRGLSAVWGR